MLKKLRTGFVYGLIGFGASWFITVLFILAGQNPSDVIVEKEVTFLLLLETLILAPFGEEFIFRFIPIKTVQRLTSSKTVLWITIISTSVLFGAIHGSLEHIFIQGTGGIILSIAFLKGGYWTSVTAHTTHNLMAMLLVIFFS